MNKKLVLLVPAALAVVGLMSSCKTPVVKVAHGFDAAYAVKAATARAPQMVQTDVTYVGVILEDDKIVDLKVDVMQVKATGLSETATQLVASSVFTDTTDTKTKWDLLTAYNMKASSPISKEWYEQAYALEQYAVGKDVNALITELKGDPDELTTGVTITTSGFGKALEAALLENNFKTINVKPNKLANLELGIGMSSLHEAKRTNVNLTTAVFDGDTVVSAELDVIQIPYAITTVTGDTPSYTVAVDTTKAQVDTTKSIIKSKVTLQAAYGMVGQSGISKEYFEQAAALEAYVSGKTLATAFATSALNMEGTHAPTLTDGATIGVTIGIGDFIEMFDEAEAIAGDRVLPTV